MKTHHHWYKNCKEEHIFEQKTLSLHIKTKKDKLQWKQERWKLPRRRLAEKTTNADLIQECITAKQRHHEVKVKIVSYYKYPQLPKTHEMAHGFLQSFDDTIKVCSAGTQPAAQINPLAEKVMQEVGIDISSHTPKSIDKYINQSWDYVITVCGGANENCPTFTGKVKHRLHIGFDDPSTINGSDEYILSEFRRVRDEIKNRFLELYQNEIKLNS